jgi:hypothetical protein
VTLRVILYTDFRGRRSNLYSVPLTLSQPPAAVTRTAMTAVRVVRAGVAAYQRRQPPAASAASAADVRPACQQ